MKKKIIALAACAALGVAASTANAASPLDYLGGVVSSLTSTTNFEISDIVGTWDYQSPAVSFKSDNALNKIGGAAASSALEEKLASYYNTAGLNTLVLTVNSDDSFTMKMRSVTLTGTITKDGDGGNLTFHFSAFGKVSIGAVSAMAEKSALNDLTLTFDVSRVVGILEKVGSVANIASIKTLTSLLSSYDGLYAGARLKKSGNSATDTTPSAGGESGLSSSPASGAVDALKGLFGK